MFSARFASDDFRRSGGESMSRQPSRGELRRFAPERFFLEIRPWWSTRSAARFPPSPVSASLLCRIRFCVGGSVAHSLSSSHLRRGPAHACRQASPAGHRPDRHRAVGLGLFVVLARNATASAASHEPGTGHAHRCRGLFVAVGRHFRSAVDGENLTGGSIDPASQCLPDHRRSVRRGPRRPRHA
jgi:hypothetical protein